ncbi:hypothetical protein PGT21_004873 [Puccinia graminis f. sp. tritici]|uniref:Uncharacterized protein n=1 Tax=Puccinia graminis f. sp. tritici TaxID=56615 RepID=A0A5B0NFL5_PUCGR|nr:hypothetical protein PGT21_004873 [Puccinia graminis f. sp. tritici]
MPILRIGYDDAGPRIAPCDAMRCDTNARITSVSSLLVLSPSAAYTKPQSAVGREPRSPPVPGFAPRKARLSTKACRFPQLA